MVLVDVNVLLYAFRSDSEHHSEFRHWLESTLADPQPFGLSDQVLASFLRIVTNPRIYKTPTPLKAALRFANLVRSQPNCTPVDPGERHWEIFCGLCERADARGNLVPDAYLAALAIENGCELITEDRDYARFQGLKWRSPLSRH